jgi:hypothetical protein
MLFRNGNCYVFPLFYRSSIRGSIYSKEKYNASITKIQSFSYCILGFTLVV